MADNKLNLVVQFAALDKLSGAMKNIVTSSKAGYRELSQMKKEAKDLDKQLQAAQKATAGATGNITALANRERELARDIEKANTKINQQTRALERAGRQQKIAQKLSGAGQNLSLGVTLPAAAFGATAIAASREAGAAIAQVNASLASMGPVAGRNVGQLKSQANELMRISLFDDDEILRKVTANMLTFGNVTGTSFDRAQLAAVNLSAKLGQDLQSSTIQIGKALNDPVKGITALSRVGVSFTQTQKDMIASMTKAGNVAGAQTIILGELEKQYGGSAKAARAADPGGALLLAFGEFQQAVGDKLLPKLTPLVIKLTELIDKFNGLSPSAQGAAVGGAIMFAALGPVLTLGGHLVTVWRGVALSFAFARIAMLGTGTAAPGVMAAAMRLRVAGATALTSAKNFIFAGAQWVAMAAKMAVGKAAAAAQALLTVGRAAMVMGWSFLKSGIMMLANPMVLIVIGIAVAIGGAAYLIYTHWDGIKAAFTSAFDWIGKKWDGLAAWFSGLGAKMTTIGTNIIQGIANGISAAPGAVWEALKSVVMFGVNGVKNLLGIKSPSRLFMAMGDHITSGLAMGVDRGGARPLRSMSRLATGMAGAGALAMAGPGLAATGGQGGAGMRGTAHAAPITINITQLPGEDANALANRVMQLLEAKQRTARLSSFGDQF